MIPKANPAFAPPDIPPEAGTAVGVALVVEAGPTLAVDATCDVNGAAVVLGLGVSEDVLELEAELLVCESNVVLGAAEAAAVSAWSVAVGAEDSVGCASGVAGSGLGCEATKGSPI